VPENEASRRLLRTLGFIETRVQRNGAIVRGKPVDIVLYEMVRERWNALPHPDQVAERS
jgi:RimJ/RimL family protein N-acetyltransferase